MLTLKQGDYSGNVTHAKIKEGVTTCITNYCMADYNSSFHYHENAHFSFMVEGGCVEKKANEYEIVPGDITYYSPGEKHQVVKVAKASRRVNLEMAAHFFDNFNIRDADAREVISENPGSKFLMIKVYKELLANDLLSELSIQMLLLQLIGQFTHHAAKQKIPAWTKSVDEYLHHNSDENISLHDLALIANLHPVTLSKMFPKYFQCTLGEYKRKLKIEKSFVLIKSSKLSLTEIALACGFFDQNHFIRTFKQITGFLPLEYRKS